MLLKAQIPIPTGLILLLASGILSSCRLPADPTLLVSGLRFQPEAFDSFTASTSIRYTLSRPASVTLRIFAPQSNGGLSSVITLFEELNESAGAHEHAWLGETEEGFFAPAGKYIGQLETENESFQTVVRIYHR